MNVLTKKLLSFRTKISKMVETGIPQEILMTGFYGLGIFFLVLLLKGSDNLLIIYLASLTIYFIYQEVKGDVMKSLILKK